jgi:membrane-associated phospholipid phosphatase
MLPVDGIVAGYNLLLALVWGALAPKVWFASWLGVVHLIGASLFLVLRRRPRLSRGTAWLREYYPLLWLVGFWYELDYLLPLLHPVFFDAAIERLDVALLGLSWGREWVLRVPSLWVSEPMYLLYMLFPLVAVPPLLFGLTGRRQALRDVTLGLTLSYVLCCLVYLVLPVAGPEPALPAGTSAGRGAFYWLLGGYTRFGDALGTAFPSYHAAAAVVVASGAWRWWRASVAVPVALLALGLAVSAVYTRHHYVVDVVAGALLALALEAVTPALRRRTASPSRSVP